MFKSCNRDGQLVGHVWPVVMPLLSVYLLLYPELPLFIQEGMLLTSFGCVVKLAVPGDLQQNVQW